MEKFFTTETIVVIVIIIIISALVPSFIKYRKRRAERRRIAARQQELLSPYVYSKIFSDTFAKISNDYELWGILNLETGDVVLPMMANDIEYTPYIADNMPFDICFLIKAENCRFMVFKNGTTYELFDETLIAYFDLLETKFKLENLSSYEIEPYDTDTLSIRGNAIAEISNITNRFKHKMALMQCDLVVMNYIVVMYGEPEKYFSCFALSEENCEKLKDISKRMERDFDKMAEKNKMKK